MRFPPRLLDDIRSRLPVSQVVARKVQLKRQGREYRGLSPFKQERTPSFFVNDQKGSWFDFSSGQNGDIFKFVMLTEGLSFPEAVERLADEAGVPMPKAEFRDPQKEDERARLYAACEAAAKFFEQCLRGAGGAEGRRYIERRGVRHETIARFRLGFAPSSRSAIKDHLSGQGFTHEEQCAAGLLVHGEDISIPYDRFRNRVMFPIADLKGRVIAFGGRALEKDVPAKYLNSPETPLFHKGANLYNAANARQSAHDTGEVIVVEGYMDVVALDEGGFPNAVAPLGTALTEDQIRILWRICPEPTLCFDGDAAGRKAAFRAVETALPHIKAGASLKFAFLPEGFDPDDLIRQQGSDAMRDVLARTRPLAEVLWDKEWSGGDWSTPERRARLEHQLGTLIARISDETVRGHYQRDMRGRLIKAWGGTPPSVGGWQRSPARGPWIGGWPGNGAGQGRGRAGGGYAGSPAGGRGHGKGDVRGGGPAGPWSPPLAASPSLRSSKIVSGSTGTPPYREALLLCTLLNHPWLVDDYAEEIAGLNFSSTVLARLRDAVLGLHAWQSPLDSASLRHQLTTLGLDRSVDLAERALTHRSDKFVDSGAPRHDVETGWRHAVAIHVRQVNLARERHAAEKAWLANGSEESYARLLEIVRTINEQEGKQTSLEGAEGTNPQRREGGAS